MIKSVIWASMLDYPGHVCTTLFFENCNFGCEFCHNKDISKMKDLDFDKEILPKLKERQCMVDHIVLSGGECTIDKDIQRIVDTLYENGFKIGIHTNGYNPQFIQDNLNKISYIGMDIKNDFDNYTGISNIQDINIERIKESIDIVVESGIEHEFRTTIYPKYVDKKNCIEIAKYLGNKKAKKYMLQQYKKVEGIKVEPYQEDYLKEIQQECEKYIKTGLR